MFFDGSLNINGAGAGILFVSPNKDKLHYVLRILFPASNNIAEYEACLHGIRLAVELGVKRLYVHGDSALVINHLNKEWDTTHEKDGPLLQRNPQMGIQFLRHRIHPRGPGQEPGSGCVVKVRIISGPDSAGCFCLGIHAPSVGIHPVDKQPNEAMLIDDTTPATSSRDWRTPFIRYISDGSGFQDKTENERLIRLSRKYILVDGKLMRNNASSEVLLKCISQDDGIKLLDDIHVGSCGNHAASRTLVGKAFRAGFYWPTAVTDTEKLV